jgi:hypothetical protein
MLKQTSEDGGSVDVGGIPVFRYFGLPTLNLIAGRVIWARGVPVLQCFSVSDF